MATTLVYRIYRVTLVAALCATFMGAALLLHPMLEGMSPANEIPRASGTYGELPAAW
jgi:hypothetical protein